MRGRLGRRAGGAVAFFGLLAVLTSTGCSETKFNFGESLDSTVKKILQPKRTPQQYMLVAVSDPDADARRAAVAKVVQSKKRNEEWAIKGLIAIATLETDPQTRCVAVRALAETGDARAIETCLKILNFEDQPKAEIRPPDADCRWEAASTLGRASVEKRLNDGDIAPVRDTLLNHLKRDESRQVRIVCARGLAGHQHPESVRGLIDALRDADFAVEHQAEESLVVLTGVTHNCVFAAWDDWHKANEANLFANAGAIPDSRKPPYSTKSGKFMYDAKQVWEWIVPPKK